MFEKTLQVIFGLVLVIILWQLIVVQRAANRMSAENASLRAQVEDLRRAVRGDTWLNKNPRPGATRTPIGHPSQSVDPLLDLPLEEDTTTPTTAADDTKDQADDLDHVRAQIEELLNDVDAIAADMEAIETIMVNYQTDAQNNATELAALAQEVARLSAAVERLTPAAR